MISLAGFERTSYLRAGEGYTGYIFASSRLGSSAGLRSLLLNDDTAQRSHFDHADIVIAPFSPCM